MPLIEGKEQALRRAKFVPCGRSLAACHGGTREAYERRPCSPFVPRGKIRLNVRITVSIFVWVSIRSTYQLIRLRFTVQKRQKPHLMGAAQSRFVAFAFPPSQWSGT